MTITSRRPVGTARTERVLLLAIQTPIALVLATPLIVMEPPLPSTIYPAIVGKALCYRTLIEIASAVWVVWALRFQARLCDDASCPAQEPIGMGLVGTQVI